MLPRRFFFLEPWYEGLNYIRTRMQLNIDDIGETRTRKVLFSHLWKLSLVKLQFVIVCRLEPNFPLSDLIPWKILKSTWFCIQIASLSVVEFRWGEKLNATFKWFYPDHQTQCVCDKCHKSSPKQSQSQFSFQFPSPHDTWTQQAQKSCHKAMMSVADRLISTICLVFSIRGKIWHRINAARHQQPSINRQSSHRDYRCG